MSDVETTSPFVRSKRIILLRTIALWTVTILVMSSVLYFYTRSHQSTLLIIASKDDVSITLNGAAVQVKNDPRGISIPVYAGRYRLNVTNKIGQQFSQDITVPSGETFSIRPVFSLTNPTPTGTAIGSIAHVRTSPDQKTIYYLGDARSRLIRMEVANRVAVPLTRTPLTGVTDVEWSSDPSIALIVQTDGVYLQEIPSFDFLHQRLVKVATSEFLSPTWDPNDNARIASAYFSAAGEKTLVLVDKQFQKVSRLVDLSQFTDPKLVWSPDSRYLAIINRSASAVNNNVWIYSLGDASFKQFTTNGSVLNASFSPDGQTVLYETLDTGTHTLHARYTNATNDLPVTTTGTVAQSAWRDSSNFYTVPQDGGTAFQLLNIGGSSKAIQYSGPDSSQVVGMFYFESSNTLVFYTQTEVYTVDIGS